MLGLAACAHGPAAAVLQPDPEADGVPAGAHQEPDLAGVSHLVQPGQTLYRIAQAYGVSERRLAELNDVERPEDLKTGQLLFIPGADRVVDVARSGPTGGGAAARAWESRRSPSEDLEEAKLLAHDPRYAWPLHGLLVSRFGVRGSEHHDGIDIAAPEGTSIAAAGPGQVIFAGEQRGYGRLAVIDHGGGEATVYAHCQQLLVRVGESVRAGAIIAKVGRTGRASGPHLHFEVRLHAQPRNPLFYLPER